MINGGPGLLIPPSTRRPSASDRPPLKVTPAITAPHSPSVCTRSSGGGDAVGADYTPRSQHSASETGRPAGQELRVTTSRPIRGKERGRFSVSHILLFSSLLFRLSWLRQPPQNELGVWVRCSLLRWVYGKLVCTSVSVSFFPFNSVRAVKIFGHDH